MKINKIPLLLASLFTLFSLTACSKSNSNSDKIQVVASIFPAYDWAKQIIGDTDRIELSLLVKNGSDLHSYQPSVDDIISISNSSVFIYNGGESDTWVNGVIKTGGSDKTIYVNLMERLGSHLVEEEEVEGMQNSEPEEIEESGPEYDEHVWLSLDNAAYLCQFIAESFAAADPENSTVYKQNADNYISKIAELKSQYQNIFSQTRNNTIIVCDRFPFRYLTDEFGLKYYAAFSGCSAETEASFETVAFLANRLKELNKTTVFRLESSSNRLCETVIASSKISDCSIVSLDSLQSTTLKQALDGKNYLDTMKYNLEKISESVK